jgi:hypothetical protein
MGELAMGWTRQLSSGLMARISVAASRLTPLSAANPQHRWAGSERKKSCE